MTVSDDGSTVVAGVGGVNSKTGAAYVYTKPVSGIWADSSIPGATLTVSTGLVGDAFGYAVAVSADGNTIVAGAPQVKNNVGQAYVYTKPSGGWATSDAPIAVQSLRFVIGSGDAFGWSVALSTDGSTLVVGAPYNDTLGTDRGVVFVYTKPSGGWATSGAPSALLSVAASANNDWLGSAVAVSADGSTVVAGANGVSTTIGAAYVFTKPSGGWADSNAPSATLTNSPGVSGDMLGTAVAVSADGSTVVIGAPQVASSVGAA